MHETYRNQAALSRLSSAPLAKFAYAGIAKQAHAAAFALPMAFRATVEA
jgi:hypothetical protein